MGISAATLRSAVTKAFEAIGNDGLLTFVTYVQVTPGAYNPTTDAMTTTTITHTNVRAALVKVRDDERDWAPNDARVQKALIPYADLPIIPQNQDHILINSVKWDIKRINSLPGTPVHILFIQEP